MSRIFCLCGFKKPMTSNIHDHGSASVFGCRKKSGFSLTFSLKYCLTLSKFDANVIELLLGFFFLHNSFSDLDVFKYRQWLALSSKCCFQNHKFDWFPYYSGFSLYHNTQRIDPFWKKIFAKIQKCCSL